ncbi:hypothetical protein OJIADAOI_00118 [Pseudomonas phage SPA05]|uniref:3'-phosphatase, 5'-polynucleotide kinase n=2 Tax=Pakpunavirus TaxID=1921407 RepID=A0AAF0DPZ7_9CAUD|nr:hypothetical protein QE322_gp119 [Pseudomonas phage PaGz-1]YP_010762228.1 hypothetical protein QE323_gp074 [Pseudomonas phage SPA05]QAX98177.1 hypothetical protein [Pseudomonas phage PaGz-1]WEY17889.1 hypothetical protein OJIADAOI_00118 [Pseudomonas phage SPA05]
MSEHVHVGQSISLVKRAKCSPNIDHWNACDIPHGTVLVVTEARGNIKEGELVVRMASTADDDCSVKVCRFSDFFLLKKEGYDPSNLADMQQAYDVLFEEPPTATFVNWERAQPLTNLERAYGLFSTGATKSIPLFEKASIKDILSPYTADEEEFSALAEESEVEHEDAETTVEHLSKGSSYDQYKKSMRSVAENEEQGLIFVGLEDYLGEDNYATLEAMANHTEAVGSGGSSSYYTVKVTNPTTKANREYFAECNDIIEALDMRFGQGNMFKALWRAAAAQNLGKLKAGNDVIRDYEKVIFFAQLEIDKILRERG